MNMIKQSVGVDISKDDFIVYAELLFVDQTTKKLGGRKFANTPKGVKKFVEWLGKKSVTDVPLQVVMEATGRYHEVLAYYLYENHYRVCVALPNRIKYFAHSLHQFSKTDPIDARMIACYGSSRLLDTWQPSSPGMRRLRELTRERQDLIKMRTQAINRLGAMRVAAKPMASVIERLEAQHKNANKALMAVQRKLLLVAFAIHQSGQIYDVNIHHQSTLNGVGEHNGSPTVARLAS